MSFSRYLFSALFIITTVNATSWAKNSARDPLRWDAQIDALIEQMTLSEKIGQLQNDAPAIPRLKIPAYNWWNEGLHGVLSPDASTVFPQAIGLAATWNTELLHPIAVAISNEARALHHAAAARGERGIFRGLTIWSPNINIFRDPRWGRGQETYGEDPYLAGEMAQAFVTGLQGDHPIYFKTIATPKHFAVHSGPDPDRHHFDATVSARDLWETYLPAFRAALVDAGAYSVMTAYNRVNGIPVSANHFFLEKILRQAWNFEGYVVTDCGAIDDIVYKHRYTLTAAGAAAKALAAGTDLNCGGTFRFLKDAHFLRWINDGHINQALKRLFRARALLGFFDSPEANPYAQISTDVVNSPAHHALARKAAQESIVLLENPHSLLPLKPQQIRRLAVIGPNAHALSSQLGNYTGRPLSISTALDGLREALPQAEILTAAGTGLEDTMPLTPVEKEFLFQSKHAQHTGLRAQFFNNKNLWGRPAHERIDANVSFNWGNASPAPNVNTDHFSIRWSGFLKPTHSGKYHLGIRSDDGMRLYVNGKKLIDLWGTHGVQTKTAEISLEAGRMYEIRIDYFDAQFDASAEFLWAREGATDSIDHAVQLARDADATVLVLGLSPEMETEEKDRAFIELPQAQIRLLEAVLAAQKPTVLVLMAGSALALPPVSKQAAILYWWYPGQEGGRALADVILGAVNPSGRLPMTFYSSTRDLPAFSNYSLQNRTYRYFTGKPLYPFGYGLSYSRFELSPAHPSEMSLAIGSALTVDVDVTNHGPLDGATVIQAYTHLKNSKLNVPRRSLRSFKKVFLRSGEHQRVTLKLSPDAFSSVNSEGHRVLSPGVAQLELSIEGSERTSNSQQRVSHPVTLIGTEVNLGN